LLATSLVLLLVCAMPCRSEEPLDIRTGIDVRTVLSDATPSFLEGGYGRTRFDDDLDGLRLGQTYLSARYRLTDALTVRGDALAYGDHYGSSADITQLYLQFRPFPSGPIRFSGKAGAFHPEFSMEQRGPAWTSVYTLTPSAINSWYGEELRAIGIETDVRWLGASAGYQGDLGVIAGVYGWNDPIGTQIAARGWALHDRQTGFFGYLPGPEGGKTYEFKEIDNRPGYYIGAQWRHGDRLEVRAYRYDNRADPTAFDRMYAWLTRFYTVGVRFEADVHWTFISQLLTGETYVGPGDTWGAEWGMDAWFVLGSYERGAWRWTARYDAFRSEQEAGEDSPDYDDDGHALTLSVQRTITAGWSAALEWLRVTSQFGERAEIGLAPHQADEVLQLAVRYQGRL
jgi:hypothetical protein